MSFFANLSVITLERTLLLKYILWSFHIQKLTFEGTKDEWFSSFVVFDENESFIVQQT